MVILEEAVKSAIGKAGGVTAAEQISDANSFIGWMSNLLQWVPFETTQSTEVLQKLCVFYFVLDQPTMAFFQTDVDPNSVGNGLTTLSAWIVEYAAAMGVFMSKPPSLTKESFQTFVVATKYRVWECESPDGSAFHSFNDFFGRHLATPRPVDTPNSNLVPVYPADSRWGSCHGIDTGSNTWVPAGSLANSKQELITAKGWTWSVGALLQGSDYASAFGGGVWVHSFLSTFNYHRYHSAVAGRVVDCNVVQNAAYLDVVASGEKLVPRRRINRDVRGNGNDVGAEITAEDQSGYQFLQTRGYVIIDTNAAGPENDIGLVAVLPIGMAQVSSVNLSVRKNDMVTKGQEIGYFQFGGSDIVTVFQKKAGLSPDPSLFNTAMSIDEQGKSLDYTFYGQKLVANPLSPLPGN
ncbi:phosphatidylserine decarboxylase-domain-containing protein [Apodospora peruviana]|uniref:Phosphatidylserine decarboxylase-domain-containing protein n=1 Tax=Apodospora peruviana TaxID=516989 RepID=A0AAE0IBX7_9PEZI|nr:phosphatidylserine decarboxylase-domain-containing protein [Apodospora peruviana]